MYRVEDIGNVDDHYGGIITDVSKLPFGTVFYVHNGAWIGKIVPFDCESGKGIFVYEDSTINGSGERKLVRTGGFEKDGKGYLLAISIYKDETLKEQEKLMVLGKPAPGKSGRVVPWGVVDGQLKVKNSVDDSSVAIDINKRYTMIDEHPCSFCDIGLGFSGGVCPYKGLSDNGKRNKCRSFLYFELLKKYEDERFKK